LEHVYCLVALCACIATILTASIFRNTPAAHRARQTPRRTTRRRSLAQVYADKCCQVSYGGERARQHSPVSTAALQPGVCCVCVRVRVACTCADVTARPHSAPCLCCSQCCGGCRCVCACVRVCTPGHRSHSSQFIGDEKRRYALSLAIESRSDGLLDSAALEVGARCGCVVYTHTHSPRPSPPSLQTWEREAEGGGLVTATLVRGCVVCGVLCCVWL
jgi:hypothetical protein